MHVGTRSSLLWLCVLCSCSLYDDGRVGSARAAFGPDAGSAGESGAAASQAQAQTLVDTCDPQRDCFWWQGQGSCRIAAVPTPEQRPEVMQSDSDVPPLVLALTQLKLSAGQGEQSTSTPASFGLDLDRDCTGVAGCSQTQGSCKPRTTNPPTRDADGCRDNAYANLWQVASFLPLLGKQLGLNEGQLNCGLRRGSYNMLLRISGYNGHPNDADVRVDFYQSPGLAPEDLPSWSCTDSTDPSKMPPFGETAAFRVAQGDLLGRPTATGALADSKWSDAHAYVRSGYLVSRFPDNAALRLAGDGKPFRGLHLPLLGGVWMGKLGRTESKRWELRDGLLAGRARREDVTNSWREAGLCEGMGFDLFNQTLLGFAEQSADVLANGQHDPDAPCDALSVGIPFEAGEVQVAGAAPLEPLVMCCKPGLTSADCQADCGDGKVSGTESCDTAIAGSCPTHCPMSDPCKRTSLQGSGCSAHCVVVESITGFVSGDGCCPPEASPAQDTDCKSSVCGNGVLDPGETCDPPGSCQACPRYNACLTLEQSGAAESCTLACAYRETKECKHGDGCCPSGCSAGQDSDCSERCGDGMVQPELGETCESGTDKPCLTTCDDGDACTEDIMTGSASTCSRACSHIPITQPISGDGCCPSGIHPNANSDSDCKPVCGNGVIEPGEGCDDGNRNDQDSCSSKCQPIDQLDMCLSKVGSKDTCSECVCRNCQAESARCYAGSRADQNDACIAAARCFYTQRCFGVDCYCGADLLGCETNPTGPCHKEVAAAAGTQSASIISVRALDTNYAIGRANAIGQCAWRSCAEYCGN